MKTILKMLEDAESDNDEVNVRISAMTKNIDVDYAGTKPHGYYFTKDRRGATFTIAPKYTTSLDAAMSIGAEELEGFLVRNHQLKNGEYEYWLQEKDGPWHTSILHTKDLPRAIACACLQALEYVRNKNG